MISLKNVTKTFGGQDAVTGLTLAVDSGKTAGFVGANGAGKTTTIRLMLGFLHPSRGTVRLMHCDMRDPEQAQTARTKIGFVPDGGMLDPVQTGQRLLDELAALQNAPPVDRERLVDVLQLSQRDLKRPMGRLSRGTRQKINLIQGLQHRPALLILDEPTEGLDPFAKRAFFDLLKESKARGTTTFFSSHVLSEVEGICDEVALIRQGRLVDGFPLNEVAAAATYRARFQLPGGDRPSLAQNIEELGNLPWVITVREDDGFVVVQTAHLSPLLTWLADNAVTNLTILPQSLEDRVLPHYGTGR